MPDDKLAAEPAATPDPVAQRLGYLRACISAAIATPEAFDLPVLLADWGRGLSALDAALGTHKPDANEDGCCTYDRFAWPCPEYRDISRALTGEDGPGA